MTLPAPTDPVHELCERLMACVQGCPRPVVTAALIAWAGRWIALQALQQDRPLHPLLDVFQAALHTAAHRAHDGYGEGWRDRN